MKIFVLSIALFALIDAPAMAQNTESRFSVLGINFGDSPHAVRARFDSSYDRKVVSFDDKNLSIDEFEKKPDDAVVVEYLRGKVFYIARMSRFSLAEKQPNRDDFQARLLAKFGAPSLNFFDPAFHFEWYYSPDGSGPLQRYSELCRNIFGLGQISTSVTFSFSYPQHTAAPCGPTAFAQSGLTGDGTKRLEFIYMYVFDEPTLYTYTIEQQKLLLEKQKREDAAAKAVKPPI